MQSCTGWLGSLSNTWAKTSGLVVVGSEKEDDTTLTARARVETSWSIADQQRIECQTRNLTARLRKLFRMPWRGNETPAGRAQIGYPFERAAKHCETNLKIKVKWRSSQCPFEKGHFYSLLRHFLNPSLWTHCYRFIRYAIERYDDDTRAHRSGSQRRRGRTSTFFHRSLALRRAIAQIISITDIENNVSRKTHLKFSWFRISF